MKQFIFVFLFFFLIISLSHSSDSDIETQCSEHLSEFIQCSGNSKSAITICSSRFPICSISIANKLNQNGVCVEFQNFGKKSENTFYVSGSCRGLFKISSFHNSTKRENIQQTQSISLNTPKIFREHQIESSSPKNNENNNNFNNNINIINNIPILTQQSLDTPQINYEMNTIPDYESYLIHLPHRQNEEIKTLSTKQSEVIVKKNEFLRRFFLRNSLSGAPFAFSFESEFLPNHFIHLDLIVSEDSSKLNVSNSKNYSVAFHQRQLTDEFSRRSSFFKDPGFVGKNTFSFRTVLDPSLFLRFDEKTNKIILHKNDESDDFKYQSSWILDSPDLALRKPTRQSSTLTTRSDIAIASRANRRLPQSQERCSSTTLEASPYWSVDIEQIAAIKSVRIRSPQNCEECLNTLKESKIYIGNIGDHPTSNIQCTSILQIEAGVDTDFDCQNEIAGRYIFIVGPETPSRLSLCSVQVFGIGTLKISVLEPLSVQLNNGITSPTITKISPTIGNSFSASFCILPTRSCVDSNDVLSESSRTCGLLDFRNKNSSVISVGWGSKSVIFGLNNPVVTLKPQSSSDLLNDNNYHHIAAIRNSSTGEVKLYIDGEIAAEGQHNTIPINMTVLDVGKRGSGMFPGEMKNIRVYDRVLRTQEIREQSYECGSGCFPRDVTLFFRLKSGCDDSGSPSGSLSLGNCLSSSWIAKHLSFSRLTFTFGSHYSQNRTRNDSVIVKVDGKVKGVYYNDNCNNRIDGAPCKYSVEADEGLHTVTVEFISDNKNNSHPIISSISAIECSNQEVTTELKSSGSHVPVSCSSESVLNGFKLLSGCTVAQTGQSSKMLRLGNCYKASWNSTFPFTRLIFVYESDDSTRRDKDETLTITVDGDIVHTFRNTDCNRQLDGEACEIKVDMQVDNLGSLVHSVVISVSSSNMVSNLHGRLGVIEAVTCTSSAISSSTPGSGSGLSPALNLNIDPKIITITEGITTTTATEGITTTNHLESNSNSELSQSAQTDVGVLIQQTLEVWTSIVASIFETFGCDENASNERDKEGAFTPLLNSFLQKDLADTLMDKYGFPDQIPLSNNNNNNNNNNDGPVAKMCSEIREKHKALTLLIQHTNIITIPTKTNENDNQLSSSSSSSFLETETFETINLMGFSPGQHIDKVKKVLMLMLDSDDLMALIKKQLDSFEHEE